MSEEPATESGRMMTNGAGATRRLVLLHQQASLIKSKITKSMIVVVVHTPISHALEQPVR
jgi:hypothetical protein